MKNGLYNKFGLWTKVCIVICLFCGMGRFGNVNVAGAADTKKMGVTESVTESASYLEKAGYQSMSAVDPGFDKLTQMIQKIESRTSLRAHKVEGTKTLPKVAVSGDVKVVEFSDAQRLGETMFLFCVDGGKTFFLRLRSSANDPEVRLWSEGPSEIIMSNMGTRWQPEPSSDTFRFGYATGSGIENFSADDSLRCLAKLLGWGDQVDWNSIFSIITNLTCNDDAAKLVFSIAQTLLHCFSMVSVGTANVTSTFGCVSGLAKLIGCGYVTCATTGCTTYSGTLEYRETGYPHGGVYSTDSGTHKGILSGPSNADFDLYLWKWNSTRQAWDVAGKGTGGTSTETVSVAGTGTGTYIWGVYAYSGSGSYSLCISHP